MPRGLIYRRYVVHDTLQCVWQVARMHTNRAYTSRLDLWGAYSHGSHSARVVIVEGKIS